MFQFSCYIAVTIQTKTWDLMLWNSRRKIPVKKLPVEIPVKILVRSLDNDFLIREPIAIDSSRSTKIILLSFRTLKNFSLPTDCSSCERCEDFLQTFKCFFGILMSNQQLPSIIESSERYFANRKQMVDPSADDAQWFIFKTFNVNVTAWPKRSTPTNPGHRK